MNKKVSLNKNRFIYLVLYNINTYVYIKKNNTGFMVLVFLFNQWMQE